MHIGYVMQNGVPDLSTLSGPQLHVAAVVHGLRRRGHAVRVVAPRQGRLQWSDDLTEWRPAQSSFADTVWFRALERPLRRLQRAARLPFIGLFDSIRFAGAASRHLRGFDVIYERHGHMGYGGVLTARRLGIPAVVELNGNILKEIDAQGIAMSPLQRAASREVTVRTFRAADRMVVVSPGLRDELALRCGVAAGQVAVVGNGADIGLFRRPVDADAVRQQHRLGHGPLVCFVGSFQVWHGVDLLVTAFRSVRERCPAAHLVLVGDGPGRAAVETQADALGLSDSVAFLGRRSQSEVAAVVCASDVLVAPYPARHDDFLGSPLKLVEYMAAGRAIVASRARIHDLIADGVTGLRVPPADADALAAGILQVLGDSDLRAALGASAAREAMAHSWDRVVDAVTDILAAAVAERRRRQTGS